MFAQDGCTQPAQSDQVKQEPHFLIEPFQREIQKSALTQNRDQGIGSDQQICPEGQHDQQQQQALILIGGVNNAQGHRQTDEQTDYRCQTCNA